MTERVLLGADELGRRLAQALLGEGAAIRVGTEDEEAASELRELGISASTLSSLSEPSSIASLGDNPETVIVCVDDLSDPAATLRAARNAFPAARRVALVDTEPAPPTDLAEQVIDIGVLGADNLARRILDPDLPRTIGLLRTLAAFDEPVAVVMHDNPDPDAIGAAIGMVALAESVGTEAVPCYSGTIAHQENRAFVNILDLELINLGDDPNPDDYGGIILVDHAYPGINDQLPLGATIDVIIDHHPSREEARATFVDRRHTVGATSTLVANHLIRAEEPLTTTLATALWYGIHVDTDGLHRGVSSLDFEVAARLRPAVDGEVLEQIESSQVSADTLETIGAAIRSRETDGAVTFTAVQHIQDRDALAQAAEMLLQLEGITTVGVAGTTEDMVYFSARTSDKTIDIGDAVRLAFDRIGSAGGHEDMAGAQIPREGRGGLPVDDEDFVPVLKARFLEGITVASRPLPSGHHVGELEG